jgi:hypothetical protein
MAGHLMVVFVIPGKPGGSNHFGRHLEDWREVFLIARYK